MVTSQCGTCGARRDVAPGGVFPSHFDVRLVWSAVIRWCPAGDMSNVIVGVEA